MSEKFNKIFFSLYSALFLITPLVMYHKTSELFEFNKMLFIYLITAAVFCVWVFRSLIYKKPIISYSFLTVPLLIFLASQLISTVTSIDQHTSLYGYYGRFNGGLLSIITYSLLYFGFISNIQSNKAFVLIERLLMISLVGSIVVMLWGIPSKFGYDLTCLVFTGNLNVECWTEQFKPTVRMFSTLGQPNWLGAYLAIHFFVASFFFLKKNQSKRNRVIFGSYLLCNFTLILLTASRSALLSIIMGLLLLVLFFFFNKNKYSYIAHQKKAIGTIFALFFISIVIFKTGIGAVDKILRLEFIRPPQNQKLLIPSEKTDPSKFSQDNITDSFSIRKIVWQGGFSLGMRYPLFGTGLETFAYAYNFSRPMQHNLTSEWDYVYNKAHNEFVNYFATSGFAGLLAYFFLIGCSIVLFIRVIRDDSLTPAVHVCAITLLAAYMSILVTNFFGFSTTTINIYFFLLPACMAVLINKNLSSKDIHPETTLNQKERFYALLSIVLFLFLSTYTLRYFLADINYARAESYKSIDNYSEALRHYYSAYTFKHEHVYEEKISQTLAQITFVQGFGTKKISQCPDVDGKEYHCSDLSKRYMQSALHGSSLNVYYWKTKSRNEFLIYQTTEDEKVFDQAISSMRKARELAPTDPRLPYTQGLYYLAKLESKKSLSESDKRLLRINGLGSVEFALSLKPDYRDAFYLKALMLKKLEQKDEARKILQEMLLKFGEDAKLRKELEM